MFVSNLRLDDFLKSLATSQVWVHKTSLTPPLKWAVMFREFNPATEVSGHA